jgi:hypothetical protein
MTSDCIYPQIEERLVSARGNQDYESEYAAERYDFTYRKWASEQEFISPVRSLSVLDLPRAQHIEDIQSISGDDLKPIVNLDHFNKSNDTTAKGPELLVSNSSFPPEYHINRTSWGNADDIPTRVPSAALEDFPPLVRCRDGPAMGYSDDYIMNMDESILSDWSVLNLLNAEHDEHDENTSDTEGESPDSNSFSCKDKEVRFAESKDDESWAFFWQANSTIPLRSPCTDTLHYYEQ